MRWGVAEGEANRFEDSIEIVEYVVVPKAKNSVPVSYELRSAAVVRELSRRMLTAVEFDYELGPRTRKVGDAAADWMLTSKLPANEALSQGVPQASFYVGRILAETSCHSRFRP